MTQDTPAALDLTEDIEAIVACLGDDAAALRADNPEDERAANMDAAAALIERLATQAATSAAPQAAPDEWMWVPIDPSNEMVSAGDSEFAHGSANVWNAMLNAAPQAATSAAGGATGEKYDETLLPFVAMMRKELHANADKGDRPGWLNMSPDQCLLEIYWHVSKLSVAVRDKSLARIQEHAADVANMAMMQADIAGAFCARPAVAALAAQSPDSGAGPAEIVMAALETGEWHLQRHLPHSCFTAAANKEQAWSVKREAAPFCSEDDSRIWTGPTALAALQKACDALKLPLPAAALAQQGAQNG